MERVTLITKPSANYELLDSGREEKLERFGDIVLTRPDPQALWEKKLSQEKWESANGKFIRDGKDGKWVGELPKEWQIEFGPPAGGLKFLVKPTSFKHTGLFPEQLSNWEWMSERLSKRSLMGRDERDPNSPSKTFAEPQILNLFAYTGGATLAAAAAGASVTHVDASKTAVAWARENAKLSGLEEKPIRWIIEDVMLFVERELKRGNKYDAIIMDPPAFGHGPKNELWKIEENFLELIKLCTQILTEKPLFFVINGYAAGYSSLALAYNLEPLVEKFGGELEHGDLTIEEKGTGAPDGTMMHRLLPCGIFARWKSL